MDAEYAFPSSVRLIVQRLPAPADETEESLKQSVTQLIEDGLELQDVTVTAAERIKPRLFSQVTSGEDAAENTSTPTGPGLVKVRLSSIPQKVDCLRNKHKLHTKSQYKKVYIKNCEDHASRLGRLNMEVLLQEINASDKYIFTGSGRLVKKDAAGRGGRGGRGRGGRGGGYRGNGRGGGGRQYHDEDSG